MRIGLLGGTFSPPHLGHLVMAQEALDQLGLDRVWFVPVSTPPHKDAFGDPGPEVRLRLCELAVQDDPRFAVSRIEVDRGGTSWTVDTLRALHAEHPGHDLTFIVGADNAFGLPAWRAPEEVLRLATLAVAERSGTTRAQLAERTAPLHDGSRVVFFDMPRLDLSSTEVRRRVAAGRPITYLVPSRVADAITEDGLYSAPTGSTTA